MSLRKKKKFLLLGGGFLMIALALLDEQESLELTNTLGLPADTGNAFTKAVRAVFAPIKTAQASVNPETTYVPIPDRKPQQDSAGNINPQDLDVLARTIWGEARNEGNKGMEAVANVVMNRVEVTTRNAGRRRQWGSTARSVCLANKQFSAWNKGDPNRDKMISVNSSDQRFKTAHDIALRALKNILPDNTNGADHYLNESLTRKIRTNGDLPSWFVRSKVTAKIGNHTFLKLER